MELIINELSFRDFSKKTINQDDAAERFEQFIILCSRLTSPKIGFLKEFHTYIDLNDIELFQGYYSAQWRNQSNIDRDIRMRYKLICDKQIIENTIDDEEEVYFEGLSSTGLTMAYKNDYTVLSIDDKDRWSPYNLNCELFSLTNDCNVKIILRNISNIESVSENASDINERLQNEIKNSNISDILDNLDYYFNSLIFHEIAKKQLKNEVEKQHLSTVISKLKMLNDYFSTWDGRIFDQNAFPNKAVTPESTETLKRFKKQHEFTFNKIGTVLASYHIRYTGNIPGRIYFVPYDLTRKGLICSLTTKLPTVSNTKLNI